jgi:8-oxo-dGTP pyrophosphatase MutT (NUDIX family)
VPDEPIPAATLILIREPAGDGAPELLMVERSQGMAFAPGAMVFPGGRIDAADEALAASLGASAAAIAAIRETIEEAAVPVGLAPALSPEQARALQASLIAGEDFGGLLQAQGLSVAADALVPFARWVPRFHAVRRFDTMFFVALCAAGDWLPHVVPGECAGAFWITADDALARERSETARLIFPTRRTLERLARHRSFQDIRADAEAHPIAPITPWVEERGGERFITIPADAGFPVTQERLDGLWRG